MSKITCTRRIQFCAGHRVFGHENKCAHLHGHNYVALFTAAADDLDPQGRVVDFSVLKEKIGGWIDAYWDHGFILSKHDKEALAAVRGFAPDRTQQQKLFVMECNPTAENMAKLLLDEVCPLLLLKTGVVITKVQLWETENCFAVAKL